MGIILLFKLKTIIMPTNIDDMDSQDWDTIYFSKDTDD